MRSLDHFVTHEAVVGPALVIAEDEDDVRAIVGACGDAQQRGEEGEQAFHLAVSLGAVESLIEQPATMSHASYDEADRQRFGISDGLIRLSVGLESFEDLRDDLGAAIEAGK